MNEGQALPTIVKHVTQDQIERYAAASGDLNPIPLDHGFAATSQFGRTIAHGMMIAAAISEMMVAAFEKAWAESGQMKIRFRAPIYPGETVMTFGQVKTLRQRQEGREVACFVGVRNQAGESVITGVATVRLLDTGV